MKNFLKIFLSIYILSLATPAVAKDSSRWAKADLEVPHVNLQPMRFTNRSRCALDSKKPTTSLFLLVNNMDAGRSLYRLGKLTGQNTSELVTEGIKSYRKTIYKSLNYINNLLLAGKIPLLPADIENKNAPNYYRSVMKSCNGKSECSLLDDYLAKIWKYKDDIYSIKGLDSFNDKKHFWRRKEFEKKTLPEGFTCHYLKKFTPLQAQLYGTKPDRDVLNKIADAAMKSDAYITACDKADDTDNMKVAIYQLEQSGVKERYWNKKGFAHYNTLKLLFSWAWRNSQEVREMAYPYGDFFKGIALEESMMMFANGCKAMTPPSCDSDTVVKNVLREFAKDEYKKKDLDILTDLPSGAQDDMINDAFTDVNTDILDLSSHGSASDWAENYSKNLSQARGLMKTKLINATNFLTLISNNLSSGKLKKLIDTQFETIDTSDKKNELFYLCAEYYFAGHEKFSTIKNNLESLKKTKLIDGLASSLTEKSTLEFFNYYEGISSQVRQKCNSLEQRQIWNDEFELEKNGYNNWYVEKVLDGKYKSTVEQRAQDYLENNKPVLAFKKYKDSGKYEDSICASPTHCARKVLKSIVDLYSVTQYAATFWTVRQQVQTPDLFNPYAERTSCKVYDPWYKTKAIMFNFMADISQSALSLYTPGMIYSSVNLKPGTVTSFNQMVTEGKIQYDTDYDKQGVQASLISDFGPLLGVPCAISLTKSDINPYNQFRFTGVSVSACAQNENNDLAVFSGSDIRDNDERNFSGCASCALNFESVATSLTRVSQNVGPTFFLVKAFVRLFKGLKDPLNIPRTWKADPNLVLQSYRRFGEIKKSCVRKLRKGKACLANSCEESVAKRINENITSYIEEINLDSWSRNAKVKVKGCSEFIEVSVNQSQDNTNSCSTSRKIKVPASCKGLIK